MKVQTIESAAKKIADESAESELSISKIYWFENPQQIRLVNVDAETIKSSDETIHPFYFNANQDVPFPSGIALVHPDEVKKKALPREWKADWADAKLIYERK